MTEYSAVMTCWNHLEVTRGCLPTFEQTQANWECIVVDNDSEDKTGEWLIGFAEDRDWVKIVLLDENRGYSGGLNAGLDQSTGDYIVLMNNDIQCMAPNWLDVLFAPVKENPRRLVGPRLLADNALTDMGDGPVPYLEGWMLGGTKEFWDEMEGMDERYALAWFEDVDIAYRAMRAGYDLCPVPNTPVFHMGGQTAYRSGLNYMAITKANKERFRAVYHGWGDE